MSFSAALRFGDSLSLNPKLIWLGGQTGQHIPWDDLAVAHCAGIMPCASLPRNPNSDPHSCPAKPSSEPNGLLRQGRILSGWS